MFRPLCGAALVLFVAGPARAQTDPEPLPRVVADVRVAMPRFKADPAIATNLTVTTGDLPTSGLGIVAGAHVYPLRTRYITFGLGAELLRSGGGRTREPTVEGGQQGATVDTRLSALSPQFSFNFGHRDGWSYISGGLGSATLMSEVAPTTGVRAETGSSRRKTINYGGGARWFVQPRLAVSLDLRFFAVSPLVGTTTAPGYPRMTVMVLTGGVAFR